MSAQRTEHEHQGGFACSPSDQLKFVSEPKEPSQAEKRLPYSAKVKPHGQLFTVGMAVSLLLHIGVLLSPLTLIRLPREHEMTTRRLNIVITAPQADRQTVELRKSVEDSRPSDRAVQKKEQEKIERPAPLETINTTINMPPVQTFSDLPDTLHLPSTTVQPTGIAHAAGAASQQGNSDMQQNQQSVSRRSDETELINAYVSMLSKLINSHLIYPTEARAKGLEGVAWVSFVVTDSGAVQAGSLLIKTSSGYAVLDRSALQTITSLAPFQRPPRKLTVSLGIDFSVDR